MMTNANIAGNRNLNKLSSAFPFVNPFGLVVYSSSFEGVPVTHGLYAALLSTAESLHINGVKCGRYGRYMRLASFTHR